MKLYGFKDAWVEVEGEVGRVEDLRRGFEGRGNEFLCRGGAEIEYEHGTFLAFRSPGGLAFKVQLLLDSSGCWGFAVFQDGPGAALPAVAVGWRFDSAVVDIEVDGGLVWEITVWPG